MLASLVVGVPLIEGVLFAADNPTQDPITFFVGQGVLGIVSYLIYREYRDEKNKREAQTEKMMTEIIPLLTRGTEAMERMAEAEAKRRSR